MGLLVITNRDDDATRRRHFGGDLVPTKVRLLPFIHGQRGGSFRVEVPLEGGTHQHSGGHEQKALACAVGNGRSIEGDGVMRSSSAAAAVGRAVMLRRGASSGTAVAMSSTVVPIVALPPDTR